MRSGLLVTAAAAVLALIASCKRSSGTSDNVPSGPDAGNFDKSALLRSFGACAAASYKDAQAAAIELEARAKTAEADGTAESRAAAQEAWKKTIDAWQRAEPFQFGPAAMTGAPGGQDLRDPIYAWPLVSRCLVDQQIVSQVYDKPELATSLVSTRTLASMEYLLFHGGGDNGCPVAASINVDGSWAALGDANVGKRKASYARALASDTVARLGRLVDAWDPGKGNFGAELAGAGTTKTFATQQMAFNAVNEGFFYIDDFVKNMKVGHPAGLYNCTAASCLDAVESPWAKRSKEHLANNLTGWDRMLSGCDAGGNLGWDDYLVAIGAGGVSDKLKTQLAAARAALEALKEPTFEEDIQKNMPGVQALFDALRAIVVTLKSEFVTVLDLELPKRVEGDND